MTPPRGVAITSERSTRRASRSSVAEPVAAGGRGDGVRELGAERPGEDAERAEEGALRRRRAARTRCRSRRAGSRWRARPTGSARCSRSKRRSRCASSSPLVSERARAAASSIASGTPSSRRQSSAIAANSAARRRGARTGRARALVEEARRGRGLDVGAVAARRQRERPEHEQRLAVDAERLAARREHAQRRQLASRSSRQSAAAAARTCSQLSSTRRAGCVAEAEHERARATGSRAGRPPRRRSRRAARAPRAGSGGAGRRPRAELARADLLGEPRLPDPARPDDGHEPVRPQRRGEPRALRFAPQELRDGRHRSERANPPWGAPRGSCGLTALPDAQASFLRNGRETGSSPAATPRARARGRGCRNGAKMRNRIAFLATAAAAAALALGGCAERPSLPPASGYGPNPSLPPPEPTTVPTIEVAKATGWPEGARPTAAAGLAVAPFAAGLDHPRWLYVLPNGDVLVAETQRAARRRPRGLRAGSMKRDEEARGRRRAERRPHHVAARRRRRRRGRGARRLPRRPPTRPSAWRSSATSSTSRTPTRSCASPTATGATRDRASRARRSPICPAGPINHHWTKNVIASRDGKRLYVTVGSNSNVAENGLEAEEGRARDPRDRPEHRQRRASSRRACATRTASRGTRAPASSGPW